MIDDAAEATQVVWNNCEPFTEMRKSAFTFYLTGSQFMGCATPKSDYDFMVQDTPEVRAFLTSIGFGEDVLASQEDYGPPSRGNFTNAVVQCNADYKVQVQLTRDVQVQRKCRDIIKTYLGEQHIRAGREARMEIWNLVARVVTWVAFDDFDSLIF